MKITEKELSASMEAARELISGMKMSKRSKPATQEPPPSETDELKSRQHRLKSSEINVERGGYGEYHRKCLICDKVYLKTEYNQHPQVCDNCMDNL